MEQRVKNAIDTFLDAIKNETLAKGTCIACAVGNLVAKGLDAKVVKREGGFICNKQNSEWEELFLTAFGEQTINKYNAHKPEIIKNIEATEFSWQELAQIEKVFETNTKIYYSDYDYHTPSEILDDRIRGLEAVIEVMLSFSNDKVTDVKQVFTEKALSI